MKKIIFLPFCIISVHALAQTTFAITGGINRSTFATTPKHESSSWYAYRTNPSLFIRAGVTADISLGHRLSLQPGLLINNKGSRLNANSWSDNYRSTIELLYLELPVNIIYRTPISKQLEMLAGAGLYAARAVLGWEAGSGESIGGRYTISDWVQFNTRNEHQLLPTVIKPYDFGWNALVGIGWKKFVFSVAYSRGFKGIIPNPELYGSDYKNAVFSASLSWSFRLKRA